MPKPRVKRHAVIQPLDQPYRFIPLTQGQTAIVDVGDFEGLSRWNWHAQRTPDSRKFYAARYDVDRKSNTQMTSEILKTRQTVDHKDGNSLNYRRKNLRKCTDSQNVSNVLRPARNNTSGFRGVSRFRNSWRTHIRKGGKVVALGTFKTAREAALIYDREARALHGKFAFQNFR